MPISPHFEMNDSHLPSPFSLLPALLFPVHCPLFPSPCPKPISLLHFLTRSLFYCLHCTLFPPPGAQSNRECPNAQTTTAPQPTAGPALLLKRPTFPQFHSFNVHPFSVKNRLFFAHKSFIPSSPSQNHYPPSPLPCGKLGEFATQFMKTNELQPQNSRKRNPKTTKKPPKTVIFTPNIDHFQPKTADSSLPHFFTHSSP